MVCRTSSKIPFQSRRIVQSKSSAEGTAGKVRRTNVRAAELRKKPDTSQHLKVEESGNSLTNPEEAF